MAEYLKKQVVVDALASVPISNIYQKIGGEWIEKPSATIATTLTKADAANLLSGPYINQVKVGNSTGVIRDTAAHDEIAELRDMIERLKGKPYYMKIQCHNCGASLEIESSNHLVKCKYCKTAYFSGTQLVNSSV